MTMREIRSRGKTPHHQTIADSQTPPYSSDRLCQVVSNTWYPGTWYTFEHYIHRVAATTTSIIILLIVRVLQQ